MAAQPGKSSKKPAARLNAQGGSDPDEKPPFTQAERVHALRIVELFGPIIPALATALGPRTEVLLHDLTRVPRTIAAIGGSITGRDVGGPPTDLGLRSFRAGQREHMIGYRTETDDGLVMRSSSLYFYARSGKPVACLCINTDINDLVQAQKVLATLTATTDTDPLDGETPSDSAEHFPVSVDTLIEDILRDAIAAVGVPIHLMKKTHKIEVVRELELRGFFTIREAVDLAATHLDVSRYTVYNYLNELQATRGERPSGSAG